MQELPKLASALIRVAIQDLEACEHDPNYVVYMGSWHEPTPEGCEVCLAGAVMAQSLGVGPNENKVPSEFGGPVLNNTLVALDWLRAGDTHAALTLLDLIPPMSPPARLPVKRAITHYAIDPVQFKRDMRAYADELEQEGF